MCISPGFSKSSGLFFSSINSVISTERDIARPYNGLEQQSKAGDEETDEPLARKAQVVE